MCLLHFHSAFARFPTADPSSVQSHCRGSVPPDIEPTIDELTRRNLKARPDEIGWTVTDHEPFAPDRLAVLYRLDLRGTNRFAGKQRMEELDMTQIENVVRLQLVIGVDQQ